jgi:hypothetical protein
VHEVIPDELESRSHLAAQNPKVAFQALATAAKP